MSDSRHFAAAVVGGQATAIQIEGVSDSDSSTEIRSDASSVWCLEA